MDSTSIEQLSNFLEILKDSQRELILSSAKALTLPADKTVFKISALENAIAATEATILEQKSEKLTAR